MLLRGEDVGIGAVALEHADDIRARLAALEANPPGPIPEHPPDQPEP